MEKRTGFLLPHPRKVGGGLDVQDIILEGGRANYLSVDAINDLTQAVEATDMRLIISSQAGTFCAGLNLDDIRRYGSAEEHLNGLIKLYKALANHPWPTASIVRGPAIGGGVGLALCTDAIVAACDTWFRLPSEAPYQPLAEVLFPIVAERRRVTYVDFETWYGSGIGAAALKEDKYIDEVVHPCDVERIAERLRERHPPKTKKEEEALTEEATAVAMEQRVVGVWVRKPCGKNRPLDKRPDSENELKARLDVAIAASSTAAFHVASEGSLKRLPREKSAVFVVHDLKNEPLQLAISGVLKAMGLEYLPLSEVRRTSGCSSLLWPSIYAAFKMAQAVLVIFTADDEARRRSDPESSRVLQPRPNVLVEAGLALGMCPYRTVLMRVAPAKVPDDLSWPYKDPTDLAGHYYVDVPSKDWPTVLARWLKAAGCPVTGTPSQDVREALDRLAK